MSDQFTIPVPRVDAQGADLTQYSVQLAFNLLTTAVNSALNVLAAGSLPPSGPAGGDLSGTYPNPTVSAVHATAGTLDGVTVGSLVPEPASVTALTVTGSTAHGVMLGEGSSAVAYVAPGAAATILGSNGTTSDPSFQTAGALGLTGTASPAFTGTPTAPTAGAHTNTTQIATTAFVETEFASPPLAGIGSVTTAPGKFTTLSASGAVTGAGFTSYLASPPAIGGTAPAAGAFTTLSASGAVSGAGFTSYLASPPAIGGTAPAAGAFTTLSSTGNFTPSQTNGIVGTTAANNANAGSVGEYVSATVGSTALVNSTNTNCASISLTAGDWDVSGVVSYSGATGATTYITGINTVSATLPPVGQRMAFAGAGLTSFTTDQASPTVRISIAATTTIFLIGFSTAASQGNYSAFMRARRVR